MSRFLKSGFKVVISFFIFLVLICLVFASGKLSDVIFHFYNWETAYDEEIESDLKFILIGNSGENENSKIELHKMYFINNFNNNTSDFDLIETEITNSIENKSEYPLENTEFGNFQFLWNSKANIASWVIDIETSNGWDVLGLFNIYIYELDGTFDFKGISLNKVNLNKSGLQLGFTRTSSEEIIQTDYESFNFLFWAQAEDFLDKEFPERKNQKYRFVNNGKLVAEFDYSSGIGYKINFE